jgi:hypothetical protein
MQPIATPSNKTKIITAEGQETFVPESIAADDALLKRLLASFFGTDQFRIERKQENGEIVIHVSKLAGAKGAVAIPLEVLKKRGGGENPVILLYRELADIDILSQPEQAALYQGRIEEALKVGGRQRERMQAARTRLKEATPTPSPVAIPGL